MQRIMQITLPLDGDLVETIRAYNQAVQVCINYGWEQHTCNKNKIHAATYYPLREQFPALQSSLVQCARDQASDILKRENFKHSKPAKKPLSAIRCNLRTFTPFLESREISISTLAGRKRYALKIPSYFEQYLAGQVTALFLGVSRQGRLIACLSVELPIVPVKEVETFVGVDRGIARVAVLSNNLFVASKHINAVKWQYQQLRRSLQAKGTRRAKRKLKELSGRERRFMACENRRIAKVIAGQADCIVIENLKGIKTNSKKERKISKKIRRRFGNWAYFQLEQFLIQSAEQSGQTILYVSPKWTSQRCSRCGSIAKGNRKSQSEFSCKACGFQLNADLNAARNLSELGSAGHGRVLVNHPNVAVVPRGVTVKDLSKLVASPLL